MPASTPSPTEPRAVSDRLPAVDYQALAGFRHELRRFLAFSEAAATQAGLTPQQHQALLAIKGLSQQGVLSIGELADLLFIRHHTAVELVDRMERLGLLARASDPADKRRVHASLTVLGERQLRALSAAHVEELRRIGPLLGAMLDRLGPQPES